jgi:dihydroorotate dehydrogenase electron transfer subunit
MERPVPARVLGVEGIGKRISLLTVENVLGGIPDPGQFIMLWNGGDEKPMAVTDIGEESLQIAIKEVGPFTRALGRAEPGSLLGIRGPYGRPFDLSFEKPLLVAGGIGASPIRYLAARLKERGVAPTIVAGYSSKEDAILVEELTGLGSSTFCCLDGSLGMRGTSVEGLPPLEGFDCVYTCGPEAMMVEVGRRAERAGTRCQLLVERYFKCGIGMCGSCSLGKLVTCRDGPVFLWKELKGTEFGIFKRDACGLREPSV